MAYTISIHNQGSAAHRDHNIRNPKIVDKEAHIEKNGIFEIWKDEKPQDAYKRLFDEAVRQYNEKLRESGHASRVQTNYYKSIKDNAKKHAVYETITAIGNFKNHPDTNVIKQILREFYETWSERNPNLELIGCYYHEDEGKNGSKLADANNRYGHIHTDWIPIGRNLTRGMATQNSLEKALNQMGFFSESKTNTAQIKWEKRENEYLEQLCIKHGLEIEHPELEHKKHMNMREFRQMKRIEELEDQNAKLVKVINNLIDKHNRLIDMNEDLEVGSLKRANEIVNKYKEKDDRFRELSR